jgi:hypothetical protein
MVAQHEAGDERRSPRRREQGDAAWPCRHGMLANRAAASSRRVTASPDGRGMVSRRGEPIRSRRAICLYSDT